MNGFDAVSWVAVEVTGTRKTWVGNDQGDVLAIDQRVPEMSDILPCTGVDFICAIHTMDTRDPVVDIMVQFASQNPNAIMGIVS